jgi:nucleotide-binding universal stress UspA family protein
MTPIEKVHGTVLEPRAPSAVAVKNVLFATDFSTTSEAAFPYAVAICRRFGATLHAAHVLSDASLLMMTGGVDYVSMGTIYEDAHTEAKERLGQMSDRLQGIRNRNYVRHGGVWKNLAGIIDENDIDLIVVGTHGRTGFGKLLLGSVAEDILRHAACPVLTVGPKVSGHARLPAFHGRGQDLAPLELELRQIVCATDFGKNSARVVLEAFSLAGEFRSQLTLLHVIEDYAHLGQRPGPMEDGVRRLQNLIPQHANLQHAPETLLEFGPVAERILEVAAEREADMLILGARCSAEVGTTHLPWSSAHHVIAQAHCPVLTIRE